jgi:hypothetical protein
MEKLLNIPLIAKLFEDVLKKAQIIIMEERFKFIPPQMKVI